MQLGGVSWPFDNEMPETCLVSTWRKNRAKPNPQIYLLDIIYIVRFIYAFILALSKRFLRLSFDIHFGNFCLDFFDHFIEGAISENVVKLDSIYFYHAGPFNHDVDDFPVGAIGI